LPSVIDDHSWYCEIYFISQKSDVFEAFKTYNTFVENFSDQRTKMLQSDNGTEYQYGNYDDFIRKNGSGRRLTTPHTPQQNGIAERHNRTLIEMARCMMRQADAPPIFCAEAVNTARYIRNR